MEQRLIDITIRHAHVHDCPALAETLIQATQHAFRGHVPDHCLEWITPEESATNWAKNFKTENELNAGMHIFVAETKSSGVIGFAMLSQLPRSNEYDRNTYKKYRHELRSLQIHPTWQRQGIGKRLIAHAAEQVKREGGTNLLVKMLRENPNMGYYEHLGAVRLGSNPFNWNRFQTEEIIFGWKSVNNLVDM